MRKKIERPEAQIALTNFVNREKNYIHYIYNEEMKQYEMMKNGDSGATDESHRMMVQSDAKLADDPVTNMKYLMICNATLMTRFAIEGGLDSETAYNISDLYIYNMKNCSTVDDVLSLHYEMVEFFTKKMANLKKDSVFSKQIVLCMDYIEQNLHTSIRLDDLAEHVSLSPSYLSALFKKETGYAVSDYVLNRKLDVAEKMLRFSDYSCADIANYLDFSSQSYFTEKFKSKYNCTPAVYRNKNYNKHILNS
ncbi:MAG: AraC family transcriptional regulator [Lachnospiraceae bacterium]|nr:AraC family transcriptional regulator [Lachnospiraceae bacterium]